MVVFKSVPWYWEETGERNSQTDEQIKLAFDGRGRPKDGSGTRWLTGLIESGATEEWQANRQMECDRLKLVCDTEHRQTQGDGDVTIVAFDGQKVVTARKSSEGRLARGVLSKSF